MTAGVVIVGAGQGGFQLAASLRQDGFDRPVTLIGEEPGLPYQRPPLSKAYIADGAGERLVLKPAAFFERAGIERLAGLRVTAIDRAARRVALSDGTHRDYAQLVLATGARNLRPPLPGLDAPGVLGLRTLADAARIRAALVHARAAVVIGGGFIGLEFAAMARQAGLGVTVLEAGERLMARAVSPVCSNWFAALHRAMGTEIRLGCAAAGVETDAAGRACAVTLADGGRVAGDLILVAAGVRPNVELAAEAGVAVDNGIVVDGCLRSSDPAIFALGDCAAFPLPGTGQVRFESVQAAVEHARHIARAITTGAETAFAMVPWFWSDQGKARLQIAGIAAGADAVQPVPQAAEGCFMALAWAGDRLAAVETVGLAAQHVAARRLIGAPRALIAAAGFDLRQALLAGAER